MTPGSGTSASKGLDALFVHVPRWRGRRREIMVMPLGLPALANLLADQGRSVEVLHFGIERELDSDFSLRRELAAHNPKLVLLSLHWHQQTRPVIDTADAIRRWAPHCRLFLGGLTASAFAEPIMQQLPFIDGVVRGDGEEPLSEICRVILDGRGALDDVPNLVHRRADGTVVTNTARWVLDGPDSAKLRHGDLSRLRHARAYMARALYADFSEGAPGSDGYAGAAYLNAGRGCTANCVSCGGAREAQWLTSARRGLTVYPIDKLMRDTHEALASGATTLRMSFDPPPARRAIRAWFERIREERLSLNLIYDLWYLPSEGFLDDVAGTFARPSTLVFSPECGSESLRQRIRGLPFKNESLIRALRAAEERGLRTHCFFTAGLPGETPLDLDETARLIERIRTETSCGISVCPMVLDPASPAFQHPNELGVTLVRKSIQDFYDGNGLTDGPGYTTEHFSEQGIMEACNRLLAVAGLPRLG